MKEPTKADLAAAVTRLTEENEALRDLLGAVQAMATAPRPATYSDEYYWACLDRLSTIAVWAELDEHATGPLAARIIHGWAERMREKAAVPVRYEVRAEPARAEVLAASIADGTPLLVTDDEPEDHPDTAGPTYGEAELRRADACRVEHAPAVTE